MANRDLTSIINPVFALNSSHITGNTTVTGSIINMSGYDSINFTLIGTSITDGTYTPVILESNNSDMSDSDITPMQFIISYNASGVLDEADTSYSALNPNALINKIGYVGKKQYVQLTMVSTAVTTGGTILAIAEQGDAKRNPIPWNGVNDVSPDSVGY